jgi:hypothetical protein
VPPAAAEISSLRSHAQRGLQSPAQEMGIGAIFFKKNNLVRARQLSGRTE